MLVVKEFNKKYSWLFLREKDLNLRPQGYEPCELPDCSIPQLLIWPVLINIKNKFKKSRRIKKALKYFFLLLNQFWSKDIIPVVFGLSLPPGPGSKWLPHFKRKMHAAICLNWTKGKI